MKAGDFLIRMIFIFCILWSTIFVWTSNRYRKLYAVDPIVLSAINAKSEVIRQSGGNLNKDVLRKSLPKLKSNEILDDHNRTTIWRNHCKCVRCSWDPVCGKLWKGNQPYGEVQTSFSKWDIPIHVVVSYCKGDLDYISAVTEGYNIASIHVISKCGYEVKGVDSNATVEVLPNVGRCDHSYAHYIATVLDQKLQETGTPGDDALVLFLKDNAGARNLRQSGRWNSLSNMVEVASYQAGFACGMVPEFMFKARPIFSLSAHYDLEELRKFAIEAYGSVREYDGDDVPFRSNFSTLGDFYDHLATEPLKRETVQVCFGGVFAASVKQIKKHKIGVWKLLAEALSRGDSIQEGHYAERIWALLLAAPLEPYQVDALKKFSAEVLRFGYQKRFSGSGYTMAVVGAIVKRLDHMGIRKHRAKTIECNSTRHCWNK